MTVSIDDKGTTDDSNDDLLVFSSAAPLQFAENTVLTFTVAAEEEGSTVVMNYLVTVAADDDAPTSSALTPPSFTVSETIALSDHDPAPQPVDLNTLFVDPEGKELSFRFTDATVRLISTGGVGIPKEITRTIKTNNDSILEVDGVVAFIDANSTLTLTGTPANFESNASITLTIEASDGTNKVQNAIVVTVAAKDDAPRAVDERALTVTIPDDVPFNQTIADLRGLFYDPDTDPELFKYHPLYNPLNENDQFQFRFSGDSFFEGRLTRSVVGDKLVVSGGPIITTEPATATLIVSASDTNPFKSDRAGVKTIVLALDGEDDAPILLEQAPLVFATQKGDGFEQRTLAPSTLFSDDGGVDKLTLKVEGFKPTLGIESVSRSTTTMCLSLAGNSRTMSTSAQGFSFSLVATDEGGERKATAKLIVLKLFSRSPTDEGHHHRRALDYCGRLATSMAMGSPTSPSPRTPEAFLMKGGAALANERALTDASPIDGIPDAVSVR